MNLGYKKFTGGNMNFNRLGNGGRGLFVVLPPSQLPCILMWEDIQKRYGLRGPNHQLNKENSYGFSWPKHNLSVSYFLTESPENKNKNLSPDFKESKGQICHNPVWSNLNLSFQHNFAGHLRLLCSLSFYFSYFQYFGSPNRDNYNEHPCSLKCYLTSTTKRTYARSAVLHNFNNNNNNNTGFFSFRVVQSLIRSQSYDVICLDKDS